MFVVPAMPMYDNSTCATEFPSVWKHESKRIYPPWYHSEFCRDNARNREASLSTILFIFMPYVICILYTCFKREFCALIKHVYILEAQTTGISEIDLLQLSVSSQKCISP